MNEKKVSRGQQMLMLFQFLLVGIGLLNTLYQLIVGDCVPRAVFLRLLYFVVYASVIVYAVWGYRKTIVPFQTAIVALSVVFCVLIDRARNFTTVPVPTIACAAVATEFLVAFLCTFKKHKKAALILGGISLAATLAMGICIAVLTPERTFIGIARQQPFACFWAITALYSTYVLRCIWSKGGKVDTLLT